MRRMPVSSSAVASVGYDPRTRTLEVEFVSGDVYRYLGVPRRRYDELLAAESTGRYVNTEIKPRYPYTRVD
jgi:hypothetical protein